jgi:dimethylhistidine N-methyltransferase
VKPVRGSVPSAPLTAEARRLRDQFAADVQYYLVQEPRQLPSRYLYDALGSALFEAICRLPWYPITRAERQLLADHGGEIRRHARPSTIVELGSGSGEKLRLFLATADLGADPLGVHLVDLSREALGQAERTLAPFSSVRVTPHAATYEAGLEAAARTFSPSDRVLVLFLGSNIGNFDPPSCEALLRGIHRELRRGDALLLGGDLVKPESVLRLAYDDPLGVTAAFNRNLLVRVNRELDGDFDIDAFAHRAVWNAPPSRVEMHLVAQRSQDIHIAAAGLSFSMDAGEPIWTESSYKYRREEIACLLEASGFRVTHQWVDEDDLFALTLAEIM